MKMVLVAFGANNDEDLNRYGYRARENLTQGKLNGRSNRTTRRAGTQITEH